MNLSAINGVDFFVVAVVLWGAAVGFYLGLFRQIGSLIVLYFATVLASQYYRPLTRWIVGPSGRAAPGVSALIFLAIGTLVYVLLSLILSDLLRTYARERPLPLKGLTELGGMALGFVQASLGAGLALALLSFAASAPWAEWEPVRRTLLAGLHQSVLAYPFTAYLSRTAVALLPWLPAGLPPLLITPL